MPGGVRGGEGQPLPLLDFLYDVTSSYLEGQCNALGDYGYNRDGKRGKKQIVVGAVMRGNGRTGVGGGVWRLHPGHEDAGFASAKDG